RRELTAATQPAPFWSHPSQHYGGQLPDKADIVIVGGGITGVSLLHHLKKRRMRALLLERGHLASGASGRNAGFVLAGVADNYATAVGTYGRERAREIWGFTLENHDAVASALKNVDIGHNRCGTVILAATDEERVQLEESAELLTDDGCQAHFDGEVLYNPRDGEVKPTSMETEETFDDKPTTAIQERIEAFARAELGADTPVTHRWAGTMGFTEDGLPIVGPVEGMPHVFACAGYNGHGMGFAFLSAKKVVDSL